MAMTEDQIEQRVEHLTNSFDRQLMAGSITQEFYDREMKNLANWAELALSTRVPAGWRSVQS